MVTDKVNLAEKSVKLKNDIGDNLKSWFVVEQKITESRSDIPLVELVQQAKEQWICAQQNLDYIVDPLLIEHGIYQLEAAEKRYMYLLQKAKDEEVRNYVVNLH